MLILGAVFIAIAAITLIFGLYISFDTEGGAIGMVPVLGYAVTAPLFGLLGYATLWFGTMGALPSGWTMLVGFPTGAFGVGWLIERMGRLGEQAHRRRSTQT